MSASAVLAEFKKNFPNLVLPELVPLRPNVETNKYSALI